MEEEKKRVVEHTDEIAEAKEQATPVAKKPNKGASAASYIAKIAMFSALAYILYLLRFPMPFAFAPWLELHFSDLPALIGGFALGPIAGCIITVIRVLLKLLTQWSGTFGVGDMADIIMGICYVLPASLIYKFNRTKKGALLGILAGGALSVLGAILANRFLLVPSFAAASPAGMPGIVGSLKSLFPNITEASFYAYYLGLSVLPFNLIRCIVEGAVVFFIYKRISKLLLKF